jgi:hyaluronan synthase
MQAKAVNISSSGILLKLFEEDAAALTRTDKVNLKFEILPGTMPEGYEMKVNIAAHLVRTFTSDKGDVQCGLQFEETLAEYSNKHKGRYMLSLAAFWLFMVSLVVILMRSESVLYFKFNKTLYLYSIITAIFLLSRYLFAMFYKPVPVDRNFTPSVSIIIPCFNEVKWIQRTILGCLNQDYPVDKLEVIVVDDCSTDGSREKIKEIVEKLHSNDKYQVEDRLRYFLQPVNKGKREVMAVGAKVAKNDLLVFVDSDSFLEPFAIINLVQPFKDSDMGGVSGRTDIANTYTNALTKMQAVRYYIAFRIMKAAEGFFDAVTCLSGPLSCYRKDLVLENMDAWLNQKFMGQRATFGDDRSMTNFILRHHRTTYQDSAVCNTIVPNEYSVFLKQQMRWKRSWLRESLIAARFMWKKEPFMALSFYMGLLVPMVAPMVVLYNLIYVPLIHRVFPTAFLVGMMMMALMMSFAQLLLRKSSTWLYGIWFCLYYEFVLLWQMPVAWVTFWKSTWGTRMTPADVEEQAKKEHHDGQTEVR